ncbi:MAG: hypothetical protein ACJAVV_000735 [Alphaproteobacteria bacterium]|jgi:hypothetical protein
MFHKAEQFALLSALLDQIIIIPYAGQFHMHLIHSWLQTILLAPMYFLSQVQLIARPIFIEVT